MNNAALAKRAASRAKGAVRDTKWWALQRLNSPSSRIARRPFADVAALVEPRKRWAIRELLPGSRVGYYVPVGSRVGLFLRHRSSDMAIVSEIFWDELYEPPSQVRTRLEALKRPPRILDLGGHVGLFGIFALTLAREATVMSLEPDPQNFSVLSRTAERSGLAWTVLQAAASSETGWVRFRSSGDPDSYVAGTSDAGTIDVIALDVLPVLAQVDWAKIDIEGSEWSILQDPRWPTSAPPIIVMEFHPRGCYQHDYQAAAIEAVQRAGMEYSLIPRPPGAGMLWAWR